MESAIITTMNEHQGGILVRRARRTAGLSQRVLAERAKDHQPNVSNIESGKQDAQFDHVSKLLAATGSSFCVVPTRAPSVAAVADDIAGFLTEGNERAAYRAFLGLHDELIRVEPATRVALCVTEPVPSGSDRWDALLAALVSYDLGREGLPLPRWVDDPARRTDEWWVEDLPALREQVRRSTPSEFSTRGIWIDEADLAHQYVREG